MDVEAEIETTDGREQGVVCPKDGRTGIFHHRIDSFRVLSRASVLFGRKGGAFFFSINHHARKDKNEHSK
jgi:hypothetical protein